MRYLTTGQMVARFGGEKPTRGRKQAFIVSPHRGGGFRTAHPEAVRRYGRDLLWPVSEFEQWLVKK